MVSHREKAVGAALDMLHRSSSGLAESRRLLSEYSMLGAFRPRVFRLTGRLYVRWAVIFEKKRDSNLYYESKKQKRQRRMIRDEWIVSMVRKMTSRQAYYCIKRIIEIANYYDRLNNKIKLIILHRRALTNARKWEQKIAAMATAADIAKF